MKRILQWSLIGLGQVSRSLVGLFLVAVFFFAPGGIVRWILRRRPISNHGETISLPESAWFRGSLESIEESLELEVLGVSGTYCVVARGLESREIKSILQDRKVLLVNPKRETLRSLPRAGVAVIYGDGPQGEFSRQLGFEVFELLMKDQAPRVPGSKQIHYGLRKIYGDTGINRDAYQIDHFLGPVAMVALALKKSGNLHSVVGWNQYIEKDGLDKPGFFGIPLLMGLSSPPENREAGHVLRLAVSSSFAKWPRKFLRKPLIVLGWTLDVVFVLDLRHVLRNLVNLWSAKKLLDSGIAIQGRISEACQGRATARHFGRMRFI